MKKIISLFIILAMTLTFTACQNGNSMSSTTEPAVTPSPTPTGAPETELPTPTPTVPDVVNPDQNNLPLVEGSADFINAFTGNKIDTEYADQLKDATTITNMVNITSSATENWSRDISFVYNKLMGMLSESDKEECEATHSAWLNELPIATEEIQDKFINEGSSGKLTSAYQIMLLYRTHAAQLHLRVYELTNEIVFAPDDSEVVG